MRSMTDKPLHYCRNCQKPIHWVRYITSTDPDHGFWMHIGEGEAGRRRCNLIANPTRMVDGIEYIP